MLRRSVITDRPTASYYANFYGVGAVAGAQVVCGSGCVGLWECGAVGVWRCESMGIWEFMAPSQF